MNGQLINERDISKLSEINLLNELILLCVSYVQVGYQCLVNVPKYDGGNLQPSSFPTS